MLILPPEKKRKIGSKEPENRQNLSFATLPLRIVGIPRPCLLTNFRLMYHHRIDKRKNYDSPP
jgi:hypothetical protein